MEELISKFEDIMDANTCSLNHGCYPHDNIRKIAEETKKIAIEFASHLMQMEITTLRAGNEEGVSEVPPHYALMQGMLIVNGEKMFNEFIEGYSRKEEELKAILKECIEKMNHDSNFHLCECGAKVRNGLMCTNCVKY